MSSKVSSLSRAGLATLKDRRRECATRPWVSVVPPPSRPQPKRAGPAGHAESSKSALRQSLETALALSQYFHDEPEVRSVWKIGAMGGGAVEMVTETGGLVIVRPAP